MAYITDSFDEQVTSLLEQGGVGFMPSDTIYGLSARALDEVAIEQLRGLKDRNRNKPFIILISNVKMLNLLSIDADQVKPVLNYWPGKVTFECYVPNSPHWLPKLNNHFGVRIPKDDQLLALIDKVGPLVSTSANLAGAKPVESLAEAQSIFGEKLDFYVNQGVIKGEPSTLVRSHGSTLEVLRQGIVKIK